MVEVEKTKVISYKQEPEYWRDPTSHAFALAFFGTGVTSTFFIFTETFFIFLGCLIGLGSIGFMVSFFLYNMGCIMKQEKQEFREQEAAIEQALAEGYSVDGKPPPTVVETV